MQTILYNLTIKTSFKHSSCLLQVEGLEPQKTTRYKEKIQGHIYPLKYVPTLHDQYGGRSNLQPTPWLLL